MLSWDDYWKQYEVSKAERWMIGERHALLDRCLASLGEGPKKVLEVGCGAGNNILRLQETHPELECHGLDFSEVSVEKLQGKLPKVFRADCRDTGLPEGEYDLVFSSGLMEHFPDEMPFVREMRRIVKPTGLMVTSIPARLSLWQVYKHLHMGRWIHGYEKSYTRKGLTKVLDEGGWAMEEVVGLDPFSINGFVMKFLNRSIEPLFRKSPLPSGYTELIAVSRPA